MVVSHAEPSAETKWTRAAEGSNVQGGQDDNEDRLTSCRYFFLIKQKKSLARRQQDNEEVGDGLREEEGIAECTADSSS
jgi:hypothetical protein